MPFTALKALLYLISIPLLSPRLSPHQFWIKSFPSCFPYYKRKIRNKQVSLRVFWPLKLLYTQITFTHSYTDSGWCHAGCQPACQRIKCLAKGHINCGLKETGFKLLIFWWVNDLRSHSRPLLIDPTISSWPRSAVMMFYLVLKNYINQSEKWTFELELADIDSFNKKKIKCIISCFILGYSWYDKVGGVQYLFDFSKASD